MLISDGWRRHEHAASRSSDASRQRLQVPTLYCDAGASHLGDLHNDIDGHIHWVVRID